MLLGLLRENRGLVKCLPGEKDAESEIRAEIEKQITKGKRIPESVEVPLSADCKKVLILAAESVERLGQRRVEPEHILVGIQQVETSLAAQILHARGLKPGEMSEQLAKAPGIQYRSGATIGAR